MSEQEIFEILAKVLEDGAKELRRRASLAAPPEPNPDTAQLRAVDLARQLHPLLGSAQEEVIAALARAHPHALTVREIAMMRPGDGVDTPNTGLTLDRLCELGFTKRLSAERPMRFILGERLTGSAEASSGRG